ncbi:MAG: hypothetical protein OXR84_10765 [Magnetovibrio sp.]|nr:hypothetical protein [Magnetovibrio sp.]
MVFIVIVNIVLSPLSLVPIGVDDAGENFRPRGRRSALARL